jgi:hypothetical protein
LATTLEVYTHASVIAQREAVNLLENQLFPSVPKKTDESGRKEEAVSPINWFFRIKWRAQGDSNSRPLAPEPKLDKLSRCFSLALRASCRTVLYRVRVLLDPSWPPMCGVNPLDGTNYLDTASVENMSHREFRFSHGEHRMTSLCEPLDQAFMRIRVGFPDRGPAVPLRR